MITHFNELELESSLQQSLTAMNFEVPTPIQAMAIPFGLQGRDILGSAQTGTGKTAAFCIPMIDFLLKNPTAHALVMLPTRELATQVHEVARKMIGFDNKGPNGIKTALLIGGEPIGKQYAQLDRRPRLIVGTPGRINDHLRSNGDLVERVAFVVLDEADRMLDMGFSVQIDTILSETALERQTLMFSATFPESIIKFSRTYLNNPERVSVGTQSRPTENIIQENMNVPQEQKYDELQTQLNKREGSVIIFVRTKHGADKLAEKLNRDEHKADALHGGLRQRQRDKVIGMFRKSQIRVMVATDVAARGLDVPHIEHVINYDLPQVAEDYIHRIGRTARAGNKGHAVSFISPGERGLWRDIERMLDPTVKNFDSGMRDGGKKSGGGGKKFGGGKSFGNKDGYAGRERSNAGGGYGERQGGDRERSFAPRKPFGRADRGDRNENSGWNPAADFERAPARENNNDRGERNYANNPDSYKRTNSTEGRAPFKKTYNEGAPRQYNGDRPARSEGGERSYNKPRTEGGFKPRTEGGFKPRTEGGFDRPRQDNGDRPFRREGAPQGNRDGFKSRTEGGFKPRTEGGFKPRTEGGDRPRTNNGDRPFNKEGGFKKPYNKDGAAPRKEGGFKKPFDRDKKPSGDRTFRKPDGAKPARKAY